MMKTTLLLCIMATLFGCKSQNITQVHPIHPLDDFGRGYEACAISEGIQILRPEHSGQTALSNYIRYKTTQASTETLKQLGEAAPRYIRTEKGDPVGGKFKLVGYDFAVKDGNETRGTLSMAYLDEEVDAFVVNLKIDGKTVVESAHCEFGRTTTGDRVILQQGEFAYGPWLRIDSLPGDQRFRSIYASNKIAIGYEVATFTSNDSGPVDVQYYGIEPIDNGAWAMQGVSFNVFMLALHDKNT